MDRIASASSRPWLRHALLQGAGLALLVVLCVRLPLDSVSAVLRDVGVGAMVVFLLAPLHMVPEMLAMSVLLRGGVPPLPLALIETSADAVARLVPAAGLAGDPYRAARYAPWVGADAAAHAAVAYRLVHMVAGLVFTGAILAASLALAPVPSAWQGTLAALAAASLALAALLAAVALSALPARLSAFVLKRLHIPADAAARLPASRFARALAAKLLHFVVQSAEVCAIFLVVGVPVDLPGVVLTGAMIAASATAFFMMPQGLGVNEAGVVAAFQMLGLPEWQAITVGLIRRARIVTWTVVGVALHPLPRRRP